MRNLEPFEFSVVSGATAHGIVSADRGGVVSLVRRAYVAHGAGKTVNPDSHFLRFEDKQNARIIALPAFLGDGFAVAGIKWIASFPDNVSRGIPRASAVLILNDYETGYPFACIESSIISAARTAASAVLAADLLGRTKKKWAASIGFIGAGVISRTIAEFFFASGWTFDRVHVFDLSRNDGSALARHIRGVSSADVDISSSYEDVIRCSDIVVFATTAASPYVHDPRLFAHHPLVLNISLRDLAPEVILSAHTNILDDVDHCLKASTSPHLAEQSVGHRKFIRGTLDAVIRGDLELPSEGTRIFSPFGLGILDLAVGLHVYERARAAGRAQPIADFFHERTRW